MSHVPVMAGEVLQLIGASTGRVLVDLTVGAGGHSAAYLEATTPRRSRARLRPGTPKPWRWPKSISLVIQGVSLFIMVTA